MSLDNRESWRAGRCSVPSAGAVIAGKRGVSSALITEKCGLGEGASSRVKGNAEESQTGAGTVEMMQFPCCGGITPQPNSLAVKHLQSLGHAALSLPGRSWGLLLSCAAGPEELREEASVLP